MQGPVNYHDIKPGVHIGHYIITEKIAQGGMGAVFKALEPALERYVAIKVLRPEFAENESYLACFEEEARAVAALRHPNIVPIYFIGVENRIAYFTMAYIEGETFDDWITAKRRFTPAEARWFIDQAVAALHCAIESNIVHLDIKPANLLVDSNNTVMLTDFGLAQKINHGEQQQAREAFGTPAYVSPEQITREPTDQRTDIYSLGASLYHLTVGTAPFEGSTVEEIIWGHLEKSFPSEKAQKAGISQGWIYLMKKMMERNPDDRFQNYTELNEALQNVENFTYNTPKLEPIPSKSVVQPRGNTSPETLHGLLMESSAIWHSDSHNTGDIKVSRSQIFDTIKEREKPLIVDAMTGTLVDLTTGEEGEPDDIFAAFEKVPGFFEAAYALACFMEPPEQGEKIEAAEILEILGLVRARNLALTFFSIHFEWKPSPNFDWRPLWQYQMTVGMIMDFMYDALDLPRSGMEYVAGFMQGLGKLILTDLFPYTYFTCMELSLKEKRPLHEIEKEMFGITSEELLSIWCNKHQFPSGLIDVFSKFETPKGIHKHSILSHALVSANHLAKHFGIGYSGDICMDPRPWEELPSTNYIWELRRNRGYAYEDFIQDFLDQFSQFPDLIK